MTGGRRRKRGTVADYCIIASPVFDSWRKAQTFRCFGMHYFVPCFLLSPHLHIRPPKPCSADGPREGHMAPNASQQTNPPLKDPPISLLRSDPGATKIGWKKGGMSKVGVTKTQNIWSEVRSLCDGSGARRQQCPILVRRKWVMEEGRRRWEYPVESLPVPCPGDIGGPDPHLPRPHQNGTCIASEVRSIMRRKPAEKSVSRG